MVLREEGGRQLFVMEEKEVKRKLYVVMRNKGDV